MKLHLFFAGIALLVIVAPAAAADSEAERLKRAQGLFQPLPRDMAVPEAPITPQRVDLGGEDGQATPPRGLFFQGPP